MPGSAGSLTRAPAATTTTSAASRPISSRVAGVASLTATPAWESRPCSFLTALQEPGTGLRAALCNSAGPPAVQKPQPDKAWSHAEARVREALPEVHDSPAEAVKLFAFGQDLQRLGDLDLWAVGLQARQLALDELATAPGGRWAGDLLRLSDAALPPARLADTAVLHAAAARLTHTTESAARLEAASRLARDAIRRPATERAAAILEFSRALESPLDLPRSYAEAVALAGQSEKMALDAALRARRPCPATLQALVPDPLPRIPEGWALDAAACQVRERDPHGGEWSGETRG
jgi:hypothetical protein